MNRLRSGNLALREKAFDNSMSSDQLEEMTLKGTVYKALFLVATAISCCITALMLANWGLNDDWLLVAALLCAALCGTVASRFPQTAPFSAVVFTAAVGYTWGIIAGRTGQASSVLPPGMLLEWILLVLSLLFSGKAIIATGWGRADAILPFIVSTSVAGLAVFYTLAALFRQPSIALLQPHSDGFWNLVFCIGLAGLTVIHLNLDLKQVRQIIAIRPPRFMEWYGAFALFLPATLIGLLVQTLVALVHRRDKRLHQI